MSSDVSLGQAHESEVTLRKAGATVENFWDPIAKNEGLARKVVELVAAAVKLVFRLVAGFDHDMRKNGWTLVSDSDAQDGEFTPELAEFLKNDDNYIGGEEMLKRATELGDCAGQRHAEAILRDSSKFPEESRKYVLVFTDTVWRGSDGCRRVACLCWRGGRWCLDFFWLGHGFYRDCRLVRLRK